VQNPFHWADAAKLAQYLLDLIPPQVIFEDDLDLLSKTPEEPHRKPPATLIDDQREARKPPTILYKRIEGCL
jgi:hypothetical protein